uniref:AAA+ ATPase domain-containing protein n=1 Tax=Strigamia maritima TaxID=126957 RepID=T1JPC8_STRMM
MGILISGPSGIGKSALVQAVAAENKSHIFLSVNKPNEILKTQSEIQRVFEDARKKSPSILLIEDIEDWCPKRSDVINIQHIQLASTLMFEINQIHLDDLAIIIIATTRDANDLDQTLRRPSYFDFEIKLDIPTVVQKTDTLKKILLVFHHTLTHAEMFELAKLTYGYTGSTLKRLVDKVSLEKLRSSADASVAVELHFEDLKCIMKDIVPEVMDGLNYNIPEVHWTDIAGYDNVKKKLIHCIIWPLKYPDRFKHLGVSLSKGILLYGPSGCGKSMLVEAIATASKYNFMYVTSNDVSIKYVGKSEEAIKNLFLAAKRAAPCIIFFDKIESLGSSRGGLGTGGRVENRVLGQLLKAIEEVRLEMVFVIGATTLPHLVDEALLRPGRFDLKNHVALPDSETRRQMFKICLKKMQITDDVVDEELIRRTEGYSGADVNTITNLM